MIRCALVAILVLCSTAKAQQVPSVPLPKARPSQMAPNDAPAPTMPPTSQQQVGAVNVKPPEPRIYQAACPAMLRGVVEAQLLPPIDEGDCKVQSPLSITSVQVGSDAATFSQPAILNCAMATEVALWIERMNSYAEAVFNTGIAQLEVGTSYMCRTRNNATDGPISEHGFANALDISGITLDDKTRIMLPDDWSGDGPKAKFMRQAHSAACGAFTTVLGPDANAQHADHLHLDLGCHGRTCTYKICE